MQILEKGGYERIIKTVGSYYWKVTELETVGGSGMCVGGIEEDKNGILFLSVDKLIIVQCVRCLRLSRCIIRRR